MTRQTLPSRRQSITLSVWHDNMEYTVGFGIVGRRVVEVFCSPFKTGAGLQSLINDACIIISVLLQHGVTIGSLVDTFGQNTQEGQTQGPAASALGVIALAGAELEKEMQ